MTSSPKRLVVGISGASGMPYAVWFLRAIPPDWEVHGILSDTAVKIMKMETGWDARKTTFADYLQKRYRMDADIAKLILHDPSDHFAPVASGSFPVEGMIVIPCSVKTLSGIANGYAGTLIERAADVNLKERRPVILVVREAPYNRIHLKNMLAVSEAGGTILPASPAFYHQPQSIDELVDFIIARALNLLKIPQNLVTPWGAKRHD